MKNSEDRKNLQSKIEELLQYATLEQLSKVEDYILELLDHEQLVKAAVEMNKKKREKVQAEEDLQNLAANSSGAIVVGLVFMPENAQEGGEK